MTSTINSQKVLNQNLKYLPHLDGLRALAIGLVVYFHAFPFSLPGGFLGVDIFFVISGFLISRIIFFETKNQIFSLKSFYMRRIRRIFPALGLVIGTVLCLGWFLMLEEDYEKLGQHVTGGIFFYQNFLLLKAENYFEFFGVKFLPLLHLWSISVEEQFYIFWPLILLVFSKTKYLLSLLLGLLGLSLFLMLFLSNDFPKATFYLMPFRLWEFVIGGLVAYYDLSETNFKFQKTMQIKHWNILSESVCWSGLALICIAVFISKTETTALDWKSLATTMGTSMVILAGSNSFFNKNVLSKSLIVYVGLISYPLYLWHLPLLALWRASIYPHFPVVTEWTIIVLSLVLSIFTYHLLEKPIGKKYFQGNFKKKIVLSLILTNGFLGLAGWWISSHHGLQSRLLPFFRFSELNKDFMQTHGCFFHPSEFNLSQIKTNPFCPKEDISASDSQNAVLFLGDSIAFHLFEGLFDPSIEKNKLYIQFSVGHCPSVPNKGYGLNKETCLQYSNFIYDYLSRHPIREVWMAMLYDQHWGFEVEDLIPAIEKLKFLGVKKIVLFGPMPNWSNNLTRIDYAEYLFTPDWSPKYRKKVFLDTNLDNKLAALAKAVGITYVSLKELLCNDEGCLVRNGSEPNDIVIFDSTHPTPRGSKYLFRKLDPALFVK